MGYRPSSSEEVIVVNVVLSVQPFWLYASWLNEEDLLVYRSPGVLDSDECYEPVRELLNSRAHRIVEAREVQDEGMMFGRALLTVYRLGV
jgi:hypothetical protein